MYVERPLEWWNSPSTKVGVVPSVVMSASNTELVQRAWQARVRLWYLRISCGVAVP